MAVLLVGCDKKPEVVTINSVLPTGVDKAKVLFTSEDGNKLIYSKMTKTAESVNYDFGYYNDKQSNDVSTSEYLKDITLIGCQKNWSEKCDAIQLSRSISDKAEKEALLNLDGVKVDAYKYYPVNVTSLDNNWTYRDLHLSCKDIKCDLKGTIYYIVNDQVIASFSMSSLDSMDIVDGLYDELIGYANGDYGSLLKNDKVCKPNSKRYIKFESIEDVDCYAIEKHLEILNNGTVTLCSLDSSFSRCHGTGALVGINQDWDRDDHIKQNIAISFKSLGNNLWGYKKHKCQISLNMANPNNIVLKTESDCFYNSSDNTGEGIFNGYGSDDLIDGFYKKSPVQGI